VVATSVSDAIMRTVRTKEGTERGRLSAFHHGSCLGASGPFGSASGQASWDAAATTAFARRALPVPACPSPVDAPHRPAVVPVGMMPEAARERIVTPPAGTDHAPAAWEYLPAASRKGSVIRKSIT